MAKLSPVSWIDLVSRLRALGFEGPYQEGKHPYMVRAHMVLPIPNPHRGQISVDLLSRILRRAEISREDWLQHHRGQSREQYLYSAFGFACGDLSSRSPAPPESLRAKRGNPAILPLPRRGGPTVSRLRSNRRPGGGGQGRPPHSDSLPQERVPGVAIPSPDAEIASALACLAMTCRKPDCFVVPDVPNQDVTTYVRACSARL